jgi:Nif-specific regulatory protein
VRLALRRSRLIFEKPLYASAAADLSLVGAFVTKEENLILELARVKRERDLYKHLLELGAKDEIEPFLKEALALIVEVSGARRGYIEVQDEREGADPPRFWIALGCSDDEAEAIRATFSKGVIAEALATGKTIAVASALDDPRFRDRGSVRRNRIQAVLCAPICTDRPLGVLYLQEREQPGPFSEDDRRRAETFAKHVSAFADRLVTRRRHRDEADPTLPLRRTLRVEGLVGRSPALAQVLRQVALSAPLEISVLLTGASGTGKTQIARIIHENSPRAAGPFIEVNCAALPEGLIENELFGSLPGGHSAAQRRVEGKVEAAKGGTLLLDEIGELQLSVQAKLLQLLQSRDYYPLGSPRPMRADVRVIAATNVDLKAAVAARRFREDLFYRLQVLPLRVPSLAERREDVAELASYFCSRACQAHHLPELRLSVGTLRAVESMEWPGNIRELAHAIEAAAIRAAHDGVLEVERRHLVPDQGERGASADEHLSFQSATRRFQEQLLRKILEETGWNITETASRLELARSHVYNLINAFGIERRRA